MFGQHTSTSMMFAHRQAQQVEVRFAGWTSTLGRLSASGWKIHTNRRDFDYRSEIIMQNEALRMVAFIDDVDMMRRESRHCLEVSVVSGVRDFHIRAQKAPVYQEMTLDCIMPLERLDMSSFCLADILAPAIADQLLVPKEDEKTVDDLLSHILTKQTDLRQEIAERRVRESLIERPTAQIVKLFAA